jgi:hypothetical protein
MTDAERHRLRNRAYLDEMQRVRRNRRWLYAYLLLQVVLVRLFSPVLCIHAENGILPPQIESAARMDLSEEARRSFSYLDGLYWPLVTAASIGHGKVTPLTRIGKIIAAALGVTGVITIGVIAGLILTWVSPHSLD